MIIVKKFKCRKCKHSIELSKCDSNLRRCEKCNNMMTASETYEIPTERDKQKLKRQGLKHLIKK